MFKRLITSLLCFIFVFILASASPIALAESNEQAPDPAEFQYPVPEGLPVVDVMSWEFRLANQYNSVGCFYTKTVSGIENQGCDSRIYDELAAMIYDCRSAGNSIYIAAGYRNWEWQIGWWPSVIKYRFNGSGYEAARHVPAPSCNEHQIGLGIDFTSNPGYAANYDFLRYEDDVNSDTYSWLLEHCAEYGFIHRYPEGKEKYYGVACDPMHFRYVGKEAATYITENDLCLEEFLMLYGYPVKLPPEA